MTPFRRNVLWGFRAVFDKRLAEQKTRARFFRNGTSATRSIMNRQFVVVLCRLCILVRIGPARRDASNKYLGDEDIFQKPVPIFCVQVFPVQGKNLDKLTITRFFDVRYDFLWRKSRHGVFGTNNLTNPGFSLVNTTRACKA